ncbi:hypothetical protein LZ31DRAFT_26006 [Colletotrichum somersetense]|nr:hypothetical protein LZ31DRAFT_26006 [Colletotrichum somersetense]
MLEPSRPKSVSGRGFVVCEYVCAWSCWHPVSSMPVGRRGSVCKGCRETRGGQDQPPRLGPHTHTYLQQDVRVQFSSLSAAASESQLRVAYLATQLICCLPRQGRETDQPVPPMPCQAVAAKRAATALPKGPTRLDPCGLSATISFITFTVSLRHQHSNPVSQTWTTRRSSSPLVLILKDSCSRSTCAPGTGGSDS